jgi:hypothetical protein
MKKLFSFWMLLISAVFLGSLFTSCGGDSSSDESERNDNTETTYTITFNANDGSANPATTTQTFTVSSSASSASVTLNENTFTRSGYKFLGWATSASSTSATYTDKQTVSLSSYSRTLYAVWEIDSSASPSEDSSYTVTLDANDGSSNKKTVSVAKNQYIYFSSYANAFTQDYATLTAFNTQADGEGTSYSVAESAYKSLKITENTTLYAIWKYNPCITFKGNGGTTSAGETETKQYQEGQYEYNLLTYTFVPKNVASTSESETVRLNANPFTRDGYTFKGWSTYETASTATYTNMQSVAAFTKFSIMGLSSWYGKTLYAVWEQISVTPENTITYKMNGGSTQSDFTEDNFDKSGATITSETPTAKYSYYSFLGWGTSENATTASYVPGDKMSRNIDMTLYAVWELGTIFSSKSISVSSSSESTIGSFTLLKSEKLTLAVSAHDGNISYIIKNSSGTAVYTSDKIDAATTVNVGSLSAGTYTLVAKNANVFNTHTATVTLKGN